MLVYNPQLTEAYMFLTPEAAAEALGTHTHTIRRAIRTGKLKAYRRSNSPRGHISITQADLEDFAASR